MRRLNKQRVILTGGAGFIGQFLVNRFQQIGCQKIIIIDRKQPKLNPYRFYRGNFGNQKLLKRIISKGDIVIHLACTTVPATSELDREKDIKDNVIGTLKLLQICVQKKIDQFVFVSSGGTVYGDLGRHSAKETSPTHPLNSHGVMKLTIEKYIQVFKHLYELNYLIVRGGNPYGGVPGRQRQQGIIDIFLKRIVSREPIEVWGDGEVVRDYIHIDDFVEFFVSVFKKDIKNEIFNVATGQGHSINEVLQIIKRVVDKNFVVKYKSQRSFDLPYNVLNIKKARRLTGWSPRISLEDGIRRLYKEVYKKQ